MKQNITTKFDCVKNSENRWRNRRYNFDNLGQALMSLFVLASKDGWVDIMYNGLDAVGVDMQPKQNYNEWRILYFISFLLLVGFFLLNMFVGVVVENFHRCRIEQEREERAVRAIKNARKNEEKRKSKTEFFYFISKFAIFFRIAGKAILAKLFTVKNASSQACHLKIF